MNPTETKECIGNINPKRLIIQDICFNKLKLELAEQSYYKATLNNNYYDANKFDFERVYRKALVTSACTCLRYLLAQEAEASGRKVSADMTEFESAIEELINGNL